MKWIRDKCRWLSAPIPVSRKVKSKYGLFFSLTFIIVIIIIVVGTVLQNWKTERLLGEFQCESIIGVWEGGWKWNAIVTWFSPSSQLGCSIIWQEDDSCIAYATMTQRPIPLVVCFQLVTSEEWNLSMFCDTLINSWEVQSFWDTFSFIYCFVFTVYWLNKSLTFMLSPNFGNIGLCM